MKTDIKSITGYSESEIADFVEKSKLGSSSERIDSNRLLASCIHDLTSFGVPYSDALKDWLMQVMVNLISNDETLADFKHPKKKNRPSDNIELMESGSNMSRRISLIYRMLELTNIVKKFNLKSAELTGILANALYQSETTIDKHRAKWNTSKSRIQSEDFEYLYDHASRGEELGKVILYNHNICKELGILIGKK